eukprot:GHVR01045740.1.p1 GENE.GHVR01045740.1~~GHVR01045740.1.p1  ORF type:complete len:285 (+),score=67.64 GHVR01045740.1:67-921(+)
MKNGKLSCVCWVGETRLNEENKLEGDKYYTKETYRGGWLMNRKHGYGIQTMKDGSIYEGQWENNKRHGHGALWLKVPGKNQRRKSYTGSWINGEKHGNGQCYYANGDRYEGGWHGGKREGQGSMRYISGDIYEGGWHDGKRSGFGTMTYKNGDVYQGSWCNGKKEGPGTYFYYSTGRVFVGEWDNEILKVGVYSRAQCAPGEERRVDPSMDATRDVFNKGDEVLHRLPQMQLKDPVGLLDRALDSVRKSRMARKGINVPTHTDTHTHAHTQNLIHILMFYGSVW